MIAIKRLAHATFTTPNLERQISYYSDILGLNVIERDKNRAFLATKSGLEALVLEQGEAVALTRLAFQAAPDSDLGALARDLESNGIRTERRNTVSPGVTQAISFVDFKGTGIDVFCDYTFAPDDGKPAPVTPLKLGHVAHRVEDVQKAAKFYTEILGFRVSDWREDTFVFLRCGVDHHTVNFVIDPKPGLHHIAYEVADWAELHRSHDFMAKNNVRLIWGPGRHVIGHNIASYHRDPDYVRVELFCEMDQMKDESLGYFDPRPYHQDRPQRPKTWPKETLRNYWGFGSHGTFPDYP